MTTEGFVRSSLVTVFITPNASSPKIDLYLSIVRWRRICSGHRIFYGTWLDNHPFYLCQLKDSWAQVRARSFLWFYWCCAQNQEIELQLPVERELLPEILSNLDISTIKVCMARKHSPRIPKERFRPAPPAAVVLNLLSMTGNYFSICGARLHRDLNLFNFNSQVLRCQGVDRG